MIPYSEFNEKQVEYIRKCQTCWLNVAEGGKRAGKNIINVLAWSMVLEMHPDKLHLAAGVSLSAAKMNIIDSNGFGLMHIFEGRCRQGKYNDREALYIQTKTGEKIVIVAGGRKANDAAMIKGHSYGTAYITEVNECHPTFVKEVMDRTMSSSFRQLFMDLNPKPPRHWFYTDILNDQDERYEAGDNPRYNYQHFTIADNHSMSKRQLKEVLSTYNKKSIWYKTDVLGQRAAASGRIYTSFSPDEVTIAPSALRELAFDELAVGIDVGGTDATVATLVGFTRHYKQVVLIDGMYDKQGIDERMSEHDYTLKVSKWLEAWTKVYPRLSYATIYVDSANKLFRIGMREELMEKRMNQFTVKYFDKSDGINERIELMETLFKQGRVKIASHLTHWVNAFDSAVWSAEAYEKGEWVRLDNGSYEVDCLDSTEYAVYTMHKRLVQEPYM